MEEPPTQGDILIVTTIQWEILGSLLRVSAGSPA
jgi:hypothetical protein